MDRFAFELSAQGETYYIDAKTGQVLDNPDGYRILQFGDKAPEVESTEQPTTDDGPGYAGTDSTFIRDPSGTGNVMSKNDGSYTNNELSYVKGERVDVEPTKDKFSKIAGIATGIAGPGALLGAAGAGAGMAIAGPPGAIAGMVAGKLAGKKIGSFVVDDIRQNPQTLAIPGRVNPLLSRPATTPSPVRTNPLLSAPTAPVNRVSYESVATYSPPSTTRNNPLLSKPSMAAFRRETPTSINVSNPKGGFQTNWGNINPDKLDPYTKDKIDQAQARVGFSLNITSGYRDPVHNAAVSGAKGSQHMHGSAVDISLKGLNDEERTSLVGALGSVSEPGRGRLGAYTGNTGLHFDTAKHTTTNYNGVHAMYDKTIQNMERAPGWFTKGLKAINRDPLTTPTPTVDETFTSPTASMSTPASYAASGTFNRSVEDRQKMGFAIAGELSPRSLKGLRANDPTARAELANVVATMENRAQSTRAKTIDDVLTPSQYNSLSKPALGTTTKNWNDYNPDITRAIDDYYTGQNKPTAPTATHYANYDVVTPSWDAYAQNKKKVGDHIFSEVTIPGTNQLEYSPSPTFQSAAHKAIQTAVSTPSVSVPSPTPASVQTEDLTEYSSPFSSSVPSAQKQREKLANPNMTQSTFGPEAPTTSRLGGFMDGSSAVHSAGFVSSTDAGVSYRDRYGRVVSDPWSGLRSGGNGPSPSKEAQDAARSGKGGLF